MATYSRVNLSGAATGNEMISVTQTATAGNIIHTAVAGTTSWDEIYLWVSNVTGTAATLTLEWGGVSDPSDHLVHALSIPANSPPILIAAGLTLNNTLVVRAFSGTTAALNITGYVNRIA